MKSYNSSHIFPEERNQRDNKRQNIGRHFVILGDKKQETKHWKTMGIIYLMLFTIYVTGRLNYLISNGIEIGINTHGQHALFNRPSSYL